MITLQTPTELREARDLVRLPQGAKATFAHDDDEHGRRFLTAGRARFVGSSVEVLVVDLTSDAVETLSVSMWTPIEVEDVHLPW